MESGLRWRRKGRERMRGRPATVASSVPAKERDVERLPSGPATYRPP